MSKEKENVLIVDDEPVFHLQMRAAFEDYYWFDSAKSARQLWEKLNEGTHYHLLILDLRLDGDDKNVGFDLLPQIAQQRPDLPVVVATKESDPAAAVEAIEKGAKNFLFKGTFEPKAWLQKFRDAINSAKAPLLEKEIKQQREKIEQQQEKIKAIESETYPFIGESARIREIKQLLREIAKEPKVTVLLTGETGVGKEIAARFLHQHSPRHNKPFVGVNLSALPPDLVESNLFGHAKGSFTGALRDHKGYFEQAAGGILLLDEIGEISHPTQVKLLRVLQERVLQRVGDERLIPFDVQVLAATHRTLPAEVEKGNFRQDLYERIKTWTIEIPALRERTEDIFPLMEHFMGLQIPGVKPFELLDSTATSCLTDYAWPGNIRELKGAVDYMLLRRRLFHKEKIDLDCLPEEIRSNRPIVVPGTARNSRGERAAPQFDSREESKAYTELVLIEEALRQFYGNKTLAAEHLEYKGTDGMLYKVRTCYKKFPRLFEHFPNVRREYAQIIK
ncbi:MAG: sigma-54 dependent transcriptional regulator [Saprospiraceae bacterium]